MAVPIPKQIIDLTENLMPIKEIYIPAQTETGISAEKVQSQNLVTDYAKAINKPKNLSEFENDKEFITYAEVEQMISESGGGIGQEGLNAYVHIRWGTSLTPSELLILPNEYIGIVSNNNPIAPTDYTGYLWYRWKGEDGLNATINGLNVLEIIDSNTVTTEISNNQIKLNAIIPTSSVALMFFGVENGNPVATHTAPTEPQVILNSGSYFSANPGTWHDIIVFTLGKDLQGSELEFIPDNLFTAKFWIRSDIARNNAQFRLRATNSATGDSLATGTTSIDLGQTGVLQPVIISGIYEMPSVVPSENIRMTLQVLTPEFGVQLGIFSIPPNEISYISRLISGTSGGERIEEAPIDGKQYGRQDGAWTEIVIEDSEFNFAIAGTIFDEPTRELRIPLLDGTTDIVPISGGNGSETSDLLWKPTVDSSGDLSWERSTSITPPTTQNIKGIQGEPGIDGQQGEQGIQGIQGEQGIQGVQGIQGIQGESGVSGINFRGDFVLGEIYNKHDVVRTTDGDAYFAQEDGLTDEPPSIGWALFVMHGAQGEQGIQGIQGETGAQGLQGEQGIQGIQGEKGEQGIQGERGERGITGYPVIKIGDFEVPRLPIPVEINRSGRIFLRSDNKGNGILNVLSDGSPVITVYPESQNHLISPIQQISSASQTLNGTVVSFNVQIPVGTSEVFHGAAFSGTTTFGVPRGTSGLVGMTMYASTGYAEFFGQLQISYISISGTTCTIGWYIQVATPSIPGVGTLVWYYRAIAYR